MEEVSAAGGGGAALPTVQFCLEQLIACARKIALEALGNMQ